MARSVLVLFVRCRCGQRLDSTTVEPSVVEKMGVPQVPRATGRLTLHVSGMACRHCVREVTARLRDVAGVATITADWTTCVVVLRGTMAVADVLAALADSDYVAEMLRSDQATPGG